MSKVRDNGDRADGILSEAKADDAVDEALDHEVDLQELLPSATISFSFPLFVALFLIMPCWERKKDKAASEDERELRVENELRVEE